MMGYITFEEGISHSNYINIFKITVKMLCSAILVLVLLGCAYQAYLHWQFVKAKPNFTGKVVLITGGSSGIGEQLCKRFIELGAA